MLSQLKLSINGCLQMDWLESFNRILDFGPAISPTYCWQTVYWTLGR